MLGERCERNRNQKVSTTIMKSCPSQLQVCSLLLLPLILMLLLPARTQEVTQKSKAEKFSQSLFTTRHNQLRAGREHKKQVMLFSAHTQSFHLAAIECQLRPFGHVWRLNEPQWRLDNEALAASLAINHGSSFARISCQHWMTHTKVSIEHMPNSRLVASQKPASECKISISC